MASAFAATVVPGAPLLEIRNAQRSFGGIYALRNINLTILPGERIGLIGSNGSGKTTLFNAITGFVALDDGMIRLRGMPLEASRAHQRARFGIARTFQDSRLFETLTVQENITLATSRGVETHLFGRRERRHVDPQVAALLADVELEQDVALRRPPELPLAVRRRVELARCLALDPWLLLTDEIASGLNAIESRQIFQTLVSVHRKRAEMGMVAIEHKLRVLNDFSDRVVGMEAGAIVLDCSARNFREDADAASFMWSGAGNRESDREIV